MLFCLLEPPSVPINFVARDTWSKSASLTWTRLSPGKVPITGYIINYWKTSSPPKNDRLYEINVTSMTESHMLDNLLPGSTYEASIIALNEVGASLTSKPVKFTTNEEAPTSPPLDIVAVSRSPTVIKVTWSPPLENAWNGKLIGYYVGYRLAHDYKSTYNYRAIDSNATTECTLAQLLKESDYSIVVKAFNSFGNGVESSPIFVKTLSEDVPVAPRVHVLSSDSVDQITIKYSAFGGKSGIQYLRIHFKEADEYHWREFSIFPDNKDDSGEYVLKNLSPSTIYMIYLTAFNEFGESDPSQIVRSRTAGASRGFLGTKAFLEADMDQFWSYFPILPVTIALAIVIIVIVIAYVYVRKVQIEATKPNLELCSSTLPGTFGRAHKTGTHRPMDPDNGRPLIQTSLIDADYQSPVAYPGVMNVSF